MGVLDTLNEAPGHTDCNAKKPSTLCDVPLLKNQLQTSVDMFVLVC